MKRYKLIIEYDGTNFCGWQIQKGKRTIQEEMNKAVSFLFKENICVEASGRTDRGVHAFGQVAHFDCENSPKSCHSILRSLNAFLPDDVKVLEVLEVDESFHSRFSPKCKTYVYKFYLAETERPLMKNRALCVRPTIDVSKMKEACNFFVGTFDFSSFVTKESGKVDFVRTIYECDIINIADNEFEFEITGNGFLYNMVRIIFGTILSVGECKINPCEIKNIIDKKNRIYAGKTVPPFGLYLKTVQY